MREIKFRAWEKFSLRMWLVKKITWDTGGLFVTENERHTVYQNDVNLMQYTGLKDKNGKEIYEGDILKSSSSLNRDYRFKVEWEEKVGCGCCGYAAGYDFSYFEVEVQMYEVIGNIYENPELL